ncbi:MAG: hypothetical protein EON58_02070 [Alphaproteobacteria bacterium]|nr:MAG: hypothetical protein EON58_02070 [Alphaproteobacteria bacterium]
MTPIPQLVERLIQMNGGSSASAAKQLGTTPASLSRYKTASARPRANIETRLRALVEGGGDLVDQAYELGGSPRLHRLEQAISETLNGLREEFHRNGSVSTRQEVLDLVAALVFAHVSALDNGKAGLGRHLLKGSKSAVEAINAAMRSAFSEWLPSKGGHGEEQKRFFSPLKKSDETFADALLGIFERDGAAFAELHQAGRDDLINEVFSRFMATSFVDEKEMGQYLTPPEVTRFMVELGFKALDQDGRRALLDVNHSCGENVVVDPSCGVGSFLAEAVRFLHEHVRVEGFRSSSEWLESFVSQQVVGIDKSERMLRLARINLGLFGVRMSQLYLANSLARDGVDSRVTLPMEGKARLILTNPPFGASYSGEEMQAFSIAKSRKRIDSELLFLERYVDWACAGGVIVSIVPDSILVNKGVFNDLRIWIRDRCDVLGVISLPSVTFAAAGTTTKTSVLILRKRKPGDKPANTFFGEAKEIGYDVVTRSGQRRRVRHAKDDLPALLRAWGTKEPKPYAQQKPLPKRAERWDANFHLTGTEAEGEEGGGLLVSQLASLVDVRKDPKRLNTATFKYIEIGDIDSRTGLVGSKSMPVSEAPSRARKIVRAGDILVSTVRPERGTVGVVPDELDGAICSTGFAVLRAKGIHPVALAWLLKGEEVRRQMARHNIGIAYPAIAEETCLILKLPIDKMQIEALSVSAREFSAALTAFEDSRQRLISLLADPAKEAPKLHRSMKTKSRRQ